MLHTFANTQSAMMKKRVAQYMVEHATARCATASGCGRESLSVTFAGLDIAEHVAAAAEARWPTLFEPYADGHAPR